MEKMIEVEDVVGVRPYYIDFLANAVNHLLIVRTNAEYTLQNAVSTVFDSTVGDDKGRVGGSLKAPRMLDVAKGSILIGNLAKIALTCNDKTWGVDWIAPSFKVKRALLEACTSESSQIVLTAEKGIVSVCATGSSDWNCQFEPIFSASYSEDEDRRHDSEHLLLNYLQYLIKKGEIQQQNGARGFLSIITERIPCASCTRNIREFLTANPWIYARIFYFHDTDGRGAQDFLNESGDENISTLDKIALQSVVHVVRAEVDATVVLTAVAREQQRMLGGAPNQILSLIKPADS